MKGKMSSTKPHSAIRKKKRERDALGFTLNCYCIASGGLDFFSGEEAWSDWRERVIF